MLAFYGDGSGEHGKGPMVLAGYLADSWDWFEIETHWRQELAAPPAIKYFKARECFHRDGQFLGIDKPIAEEKRDRLANIVRSFNPRIIEISSTIRWDEYHSIIGDGPMKQAFYSPFLFCFHGIVSAVVTETKEHRGRTAFVFDTESEPLDAFSGKHYRQICDQFGEDVAAKLGSLTFDTDIQFPLLQVADMLAWNIRASKEGFQVPALEIMRDLPKIHGCIEQNVNPSGMAQYIVDTEARFAEFLRGARNASSEQR